MGTDYFLTLSQASYAFIYPEFKEHSSRPLVSLGVKLDAEYILFSVIGNHNLVFYPLNYLVIFGNLHNVICMKEVVFAFRHIEWRGYLETARIFHIPVPTRLDKGVPSKLMNHILKPIAYRKYRYLGA